MSPGGAERTGCGRPAVRYRAETATTSAKDTEMRAAQNERLTRVGPATPCGQLHRRYWQPVALVDEFDPALVPAMRDRPVKRVRVLGEDLVLFRSAPGRWGLLERPCPHRGADLAFARYEPEAEGSAAFALRCPFHGWKFAADGRCLETPAEPAGSRLCQSVRQKSYPIVERAGVIYAFLGEGPPPPAPDLPCHRAPATHSFAFKGLWRCNWLQAFEVGIDPAHPSYLHRYFEDEATEGQFGRQFRGASAGEVDGERWPMTRVLRERAQPEIAFAPTDWGVEITTLRPIDATRMHVRITQALFPHTFLIPLSETITITQHHLPVDDTHTYWFSIFTSYAEPLDQATMRAQRLATIELPDYIPKVGRHNDWGFDPARMKETFLGMGEDINVHDQWAVESMGPIADRTREHLGTSDRVIIAWRRLLDAAIDAAADVAATPPAGLHAPAVTRGLRTFDGITRAADWAHHWVEMHAALRARSPWSP
jgi:phenylpropionate dioxygenase-like ring-hydroxylating dioxygenase large terminal subunit